VEFEPKRVEFRFSPDTVQVSLEAVSTVNHASDTEKISYNSINLNNYKYAKYPGWVASYNTRSGNELALFFSS